MFFRVVGYHGCDLPCEPCEQEAASGQSVGTHCCCPEKSQQLPAAARSRHLPSSSRTSGTLDTLPTISHQIRSVTFLPVTAFVRQESEIESVCMPIWGRFCSEANVVATEWRLMTATTKLGTNSVCNV